MFPFATEIDPSLAATLISLILGGGLVGTMRIARTMKPEAEAIGAKSLIEVNSELRTEIKRLAGVVDEQRTEIGNQATKLREQDRALTKAEGRIRALTSELDDLESRLDERGD